MCGIVGYVGELNATKIILHGLERLEYRGYDSAGLAVIGEEGIKIKRSSGKINHLVNLINNEPIEGKIGIGHTRWATHGEPCEKNAHPHLSYLGNVVLAHNGIVENYLDLKKELVNEGIPFKSDTDTECIVHLLEKGLENGESLEQSMRKTLKKIKGSHGIVVISTAEPEKIFTARIGNAGGIVIGVGKNGNFIASDIPAILDFTNKMAFLESGQMAVVTCDEIKISTIAGENIEVRIDTINWDPISAVKGPYRHFMQKEIQEQSRSLTETLAGRIDFKDWSVDLPTLYDRQFSADAIEGIKVIACGTANHAGMVGKFLIESFSKIPVEVDIASEFRYRDPLINDKHIAIAISQSGETADTLGAIDEARKKGALVWSIVNSIGSQAMRIADGYVSMQVGPEIGVASTKAFTSPLLILLLIAVSLGDKKGLIGKAEKDKLISNICTIPDLVGECLRREQSIKEIAEKYKEIDHILYIGRGINMPIAYEGALKLKEISYIHAEAYPAGELKHGPIALIDKSMPVLAVAPQDRWYEKTINQIEQVKSRGGKVLVVASDDDEKALTIADDVFWIPSSHWYLNPILSVIPLQLFAYHIATMKGLDVDQPRNLAKSVTVE